ncbi:MAG: hypothetical protein K2L15_04875 [Eubacteriales bacterium]|nr:hypothetical protein [Eubacteriales bacterium]
MKFKNKTIELPKFTIVFEEKLEEVENLNKDLIKGKVSRVTVLKKCYDFLAELLTEEQLLNMLDSNSYETVDMKELELLFYYIRTEYEKPLKDAILKDEQEKINGILNNPKISDILKLSKGVKNA